MNRKEARENAFLLLFEREFKTEETAFEIFTKATEDRELEVDDYVKDVYFGSAENSKIIDEIWRGNQKWTTTNSLLMNC